MPRQIKLRSESRSPSFPPGEIRAQLDRVLASRELVDSPRLQQFLSYVVGETLEGRAARIKGFSVAQEVFGLHDPAVAESSTVVRVEAGRLRRQLDAYYREGGRSDPIRICIPKGSYVPQFVAAEAADPEIEPGSTDTDDTAARRLNSIRFGGAIVGLAVVILAVGLSWRFLFPNDDPTARPGSAGSTFIAGALKPAIAVLPLRNATGDAAGDQLAAGLTEDIITDLSRLSGIDVIALSSVLGLNGDAATPRAIGRRLGVAYVLRGSVRGTGPQIRVTAQLYETRLGRQVWARRFDRPLANQLQFQNELATKIVEGMSLRLRDNERARLRRREISKSEAYVLYKQAMAIGHPGSNPKRLRLSLRAFEQLIQIDPQFAGGYAGAAYIQARLAFWGHSRSPDTIVEKAVEMATKARALDPSFSLTYQALAYAHAARRDFDKALEFAKRAVEVEPSNPFANAIYAFLLHANGQRTLAIAYGERALRLDPVPTRTPYRNILAVIHFHNGAYKKTLAIIQSNNRRGGPRNPVVQIYLAATYAALGRTEEARASLRAMNQFKERFPWESWLRRSLRHQRDVDQVVQPIRKLLGG